jgi:APA family basic amino acid/polyamine antiporter
MIGAGVFAAVGPAADAAGSGLILALAVAAVVAACNAASSAQLAALYPESGGAYVYGRRRLGHLWGYLAGWSFIAGKVASCAAMALTFGYYAAPDAARPLAIGAVVVLATINYLGIQKTASVTRLIVVLVLASLAFVVGASLFGGTAESGNLTPLVDDNGLLGVFQAAGLLFFAFAGYARIATLGEEVRDPGATIPRAIIAALVVAFLVYAAVFTSALAAAGDEVLAAADAPLAAAVEAGSLADAEPVVRAGAAVASLGVLLSLLAGVSRTTFSMAANRDLPALFSHVHARHRVPDHAEIAVAAVVVIIVALADVRASIGFSSFGVLTYYAIANASALTLAADERRWPSGIAALGVAGCILLALTLPWESALAGAAVIAAGAIAFALRRGVSP